MKKIILAFISFFAIGIASAEVYCPQGPADCIKSTAGQVTCTLAGNDGTWTYKKGIYPLDLPQPNTHYFFPFMMAAYGIAKQGPQCGYTTFVNNEINGPSFVSNTHMIPSHPGVNGWNKSPIGNGFFCEPIPGVCPFKIG